MFTGFIGLLILIADIGAVISVLKTQTTSRTKVLWCLFILVLPLLGFLLWMMEGPKNWNYPLIHEEFNPHDQA